MRTHKVRIMTITGMLTALVCVSTMMIRIPTPTKGYINLGDCIVNIAAWLLGPLYGAFAAGAGSALSDLFAGYTVYVPATFIIKGLMALASWAVFTQLRKKKMSVPACIAAAVTAEVIMAAGYFAFEAFLYGSFAAAVPGISGNIIQGVGGIVGSVLIYEAVVKRVTVLSERDQFN